MRTRQFQGKLIAVTILVCFVAPFLSASEVTAVWERIYHQAVSDDQRYSIMLKITELKDKDFAPLIAESLQNLYTSKIESGDPTVRRSKLSLAKLLIQELGNLRSLDNAQLVFDVYHNTKDALVRGEAALSLGKMRALDFVGIMARDLGDINLQPEGVDARDQEVRAFGLVQGLELMHSTVGYEPVFFAAFGWYSSASHVKETAKAALQTMVDDPSPQLKNIIINDPAFDHKRQALDVCLDSNAPAAAKIEIGRIGLDRGLVGYDKDVQKSRLLSDVRMAAVKLLVNAQDKGAETVPLYQRMIEQAYSNDELLAAYVALGLNASTAAVNLLIEKMADYNERQKTGLQVANDRRVISQIVQSLADTKSPAIKPVLIEAQFSNHDAQVVRDVKAILDKMP